jgi:hypothetical protein
MAPMGVEQGTAGFKAATDSDAGIAEIMPALIG